MSVKYRINIIKQIFMVLSVLEFIGLFIYIITLDINKYINQFRSEDNLKNDEKQLLYKYGLHFTDLA